MRAAQLIVDGLVEALGEPLSVTFRHFPMSALHPHAQHAAEVAEAASAQGRFWEMHDRLFTSQDALDDASLLRYAEDLSLDAQCVRRELESHVHAPRVRHDQESAMNSGVRGMLVYGALQSVRASDR